MKVGVTGTRHGMTDAQTVTFHRLIRSDTVEFHHGSCAGVDVQAARMTKGKESSCKIICHPGPDGDFLESSGVDDEVLSPKTHFARNRDIVNAVDRMIAVPLEFEHQPRGGTWFTIDYCMKVRKPLTVIWPDGRTEEWNLV